MRGIFLVLLVAGWLQAEDENLVDAQWNGPVADQQGMAWDLQQDGQIGDGSSDCFDGAMQLTATVAGVRWQLQKFQQTADGQEYVLSGAAGPCSVVRRIRLDSQRGWMRYCEQVVNPTDKPVSAQLGIRGNCGGNAQATLGTDGKPLVNGALQKGNLGVLLLQHPNNSRPSVVLLVGDIRSGVIPSVQVVGNRTFQVQWTLSVPAKSTASVYHLVGQRNQFSGQALADGIKPVWKGRLVRPLLPPGAVPANWPMVDATPVALPLVEQLAEEFAVEDRTADLVVVDEGDGARLRGALAGGPLEVETALGRTSVPVAQVAATRAVEGVARLFLRNGEILAMQPGAVVGGRLELASGEGVRLPIDVARTPAALLRRKSDDGAAAGAAGFLELVDGSRTAVAGALPELQVATAWGPQRVPLAAVERIVRVHEPRPAWRIELTDGSRFTAVPAATAAAVQTVRFGAQTIPMPRIAGYERAGAKPVTDDGDDEVPASWRGFRLVGGDRVAGSPADAELELIAAGGATRVPTAKLRSCRRDGSGLAATLADGTTVAGAMHGAIAVGGASLTCRIPPALVAAWQDGTEPQDIPATETPPAPSEPVVEEAVP